MKTVIVDAGSSNKKIWAFLREQFRNVPESALYKAFRKKDVKVNGRRVSRDYVVSPGDSIAIYITDNILYGMPLETGNKNTRDVICYDISNSANGGISRGIYKPAGLSVIYEDQNILIVNKRQGITVQPEVEEIKDRNQSDNEITLIDLVKHYLESKGEYTPLNPSSFPPSPCHRIDRNTGGLVIIAKNHISHEIILNKIKHREIKKFYQCLVKGKMEKKSDELKAFLEKDNTKSRVYIHNYWKPGALEIITKYKVLSYENDVSKLEVELVTGRTHQIRAHLAFIGHPIIGDSKYGINTLNRSSGMEKQALWAYKIVFDFKDGEQLNYLKGKTLSIDPPW